MVSARTSLCALTALLLLSSQCVDAKKRRRRRSETSVQGGRRHADEGGLVVVEDIQRRVAEAGGNAKGRLAISLTWAVQHDLDLHVMTPSGEELHFGRRQVAGGELDVDMCAQGPPTHPQCPERPVENVVWPENPPLGNYRIFVRNYRYHMWPGGVDDAQRFPVPFEVLVRIKGKHKLFRNLCTKGNLYGPISDVRVYEFTLGPGLVAHATYEATPMGGVCVEKARLEAPRQEPHHIGYQAPAPGDESSVAPGEGSGFDYQRAQERQQKARRRKKRKNKKNKKKRAPSRRFSRAELKEMRVGTLRRTLKEYGGVCKACTSKAELVSAFLKRQKQLDKSRGSRGGEL